MKKKGEESFYEQKLTFGRSWDFSDWRLEKKTKTNQVILAKQKKILKVNWQSTSSHSLCLTAATRLFKWLILKRLERRNSV